MTAPSTPGKPGEWLAVARTLVTHPVEWAASLLLLTLTTTVFLQVLTRYVLAYPWEWPEEFARILFVWLALLGAALALRRGGHFGIAALVRRLPPGSQRCVAVCVRLLLLAFLLLVTVLGAQAAYRVREQLSTAMEISMIYGYAAVPVGCGLMAAEMLRQLRREWRGSAA